MVTLHVMAMLQETEKIFWNTRTSGQRAFRYKAGYGGVVKGWDNGAMGMKVGETRVLLIPPDEGYGKKGACPPPPRRSACTIYRRFEQ